MIVLNLFLVVLTGYCIAQKTQDDPNGENDTKPPLSYELEDLGDYNEDPNYAWPMYRRKLSRFSEYKDNKVEHSSSFLEDVSTKRLRSRSDLEAYPERSYSDTVGDYDDISVGPTRRVGSPMEILGHLINGKKKVLNGINEGVLGGKTILEGIHEITKVLGGFLAAT